MVMGFSVSSSSQALKKVASLKIDSKMSSVAIWVCSGVTVFAREDSVGRVMSGGTDGTIAGLLIRDGALLPLGAFVKFTVLCCRFN